MKNRLYIIYLKFLYLGYLCFCFIFRPKVRGAYVVVIYNCNLLIIKNSYKKGWTLPCGMIDSGETESAGAKRELLEEVGISCEESDLQFLQMHLSTKGYKSDYQYFYLLAMNSSPKIKLDMREVIEYRWISKSEMEQYSIPEGVRKVLSDHDSFIFKDNS